MPPKKDSQQKAEPTRKSSRLNKEGEENQPKDHDKIDSTQNTTETDTKSETIVESIEHDDPEPDPPTLEPIPPKTPAASKSRTTKMAGANKADMDALLKRIADMETLLNADRGARGVTPAASAFGGSDFKPTGFAAMTHFKPYGKDQNAVNPNYDKKAKRRGISPGIFSGDKTKFDKWVIKLHDQFDEDNETFKKERSRMALINSLTDGPANDLIEARYQSAHIPFKSAAEMIACLTAVYHDDNQGILAREELRNLKYDHRDTTMDIHQFIGKVNSLADKANIAKEERKTGLYDVTT